MESFIVKSFIRSCSHPARTNNWVPAMCRHWPTGLDLAGREGSSAQKAMSCCGEARGKQTSEGYQCHTLKRARWGLEKFSLNRRHLHWDVTWSVIKTILVILIFYVFQCVCSSFCSLRLKWGHFCNQCSFYTFRIWSCKSQAKPKESLFLENAPGLGMTLFENCQKTGLSPQTSRGLNQKAWLTELSPTPSSGKLCLSKS